MFGLWCAFNVSLAKYGGCLEANWGSWVPWERESVARSFSLKIASHIKPRDSQNTWSQNSFLRLRLRNTVHHRILNRNSFRIIYDFFLAAFFLRSTIVARSLWSAIFVRISSSTWKHCRDSFRKQASPKEWWCSANNKKMKKNTKLWRSTSWNLIFMINIHYDDVSRVFEIFPNKFPMWHSISSLKRKVFRERNLVGWRFDESKYSVDVCFFSEDFKIN